jgi:hypothetical protein
MKKEIALSPRHWALYQLLKDNKDVWITEHFIYKKMKQFYKIFDYNSDNFHDSFARVKIGRDILDLNNSEKIQKIILSSGKGIKIADRKEYKRWSDLRWLSLKRMISRLVVKDKKFKLDGQMKLLFDENSEARNYYQTFSK